MATAVNVEAVTMATKNEAGREDGTTPVKKSEQTVRKKSGDLSTKGSVKKSSSEVSSPWEIPKPRESPALIRSPKGSPFMMSAWGSPSELRDSPMMMTSPRGGQGIVGRSRSTGSFSWHSEIKYTDVIVIGNGPSGICLSYLLSGHWPYYTGAKHPNELIQLRLQDYDPDQSLVELDLEYMSAGLQGRSPNPVAILFDALTHPDADLGLEMDSVLEWKHMKDQAISHVVLGRTAAGGAWQMMEGEMQTLSLGTWMQLPNLPFKPWLEKYRSEREAENQYLPPVKNRASMQEVCMYYTDFVNSQELLPYFHDYSTVTSVERVLDVTHSIDDESGEQNPCSRDHKGKVKWEVRGYQMTTNKYGEPERADFCYRAPNVVLATGSYDTPNKLGVPGENRKYVLHSLMELESVIKDGLLGPDSDPIMVIGAGLSAADAILCAQYFNIQIEHVFRRNVDDPKIILRTLPAMLYPEYHHVLKMMKQTVEVEGYQSHPSHLITECLEDGKVLIRSKKTGCDSLVKVSYVVILIGSRPNLSFLPQDGQNLGVIPGMPIDPKNNPIDVDVYSYQSIYEAGLYAMGPLVGDNFVRFLQGGALGISSHLHRKQAGKL